MKDFGLYQCRIDIDIKLVVIIRILMPGPVMNKARTSKSLVLFLHTIPHIQFKVIENTLCQEYIREKERDQGSQQGVLHVWCLQD